MDKPRHSITHLSVIYSKPVSDGTEIGVKIQKQTLTMWSALMGQMQGAEKILPQLSIMGSGKSLRSRRCPNFSSLSLLLALASGI